MSLSLSCFAFSSVLVAAGRPAGAEAGGLGRRCLAEAWPVDADVRLRTVAGGGVAVHIALCVVIAPSDPVVVAVGT